MRFFDCPWRAGGRGASALFSQNGALDLMDNFFVYIMSSKSKVLYTGFTDDLETRVFTHKRKLLHGFTARYNITRLVYYDEFPDAESALDLERQIKGWLRAKKIALIESVNPEWGDLSEGWFDE